MYFQMSMRKNEINYRNAIREYITKNGVNLIELKKYNKNLKELIILLKDKYNIS